MAALAGGGEDLTVGIFGDEQAIEVKTARSLHRTIRIRYSNDFATIRCKQESGVLARISKTLHCNAQAALEAKLLGQVAHEIEAIMRRGRARRPKPEAFQR